MTSPATGSCLHHKKGCTSASTEINKNTVIPVQCGAVDLPFHHMAKNTRNIVQPLFISPRQTFHLRVGSSSYEASLQQSRVGGS